MRQMALEGTGELRAAMGGPVIAPADAGFDDARRVWNAQVDRRPAVIARCASTADVAAAIGYARQHRLAVRCAGAPTRRGRRGVRRRRDDRPEPDSAVTVDPEARRAGTGGGALLADLDAETQAHGLAVPAGMVSHTGVGGLTLGGGMGWLTRKHGLSIDNLVSAEVVTADGEVVRAAGDEHPDLFWALRGGGGNFGVVTSFEFELHEVGPMVQFGLFFWGLDQGPQALRLAGESPRRCRRGSTPWSPRSTPRLAIRPGAAPADPRLRPAARRIRGRARARRARLPDPRRLPALVRAGRPDALCRAAAAAR